MAVEGIQDRSKREPDWPGRQGVLFFVLIPLLIGMLLGANRTGIAMHMSWPVGVVFWSVTTVGVWLLLYLGSELAGALLKPWQPSLAVVLVVGAIIGSLAARYLMYYSVEAVQSLLLSGRTPQALPSFSASWSFVGYYLKAWFGVFLLWTAIGLFFDHLFHFPRYSRTFGSEHADAGVARGPARENGPANPGEPAPVVPQCPLLERLPDRLGNNVIALKAEDHYVRVYTDRGSDLVLHRFSDAIRELGPESGIRVHRSYWVRPDAVQTVSSHGRGMLLTLSNELEVPVSQTYAALAREAGLAPDQ